MFTRIFLIAIFWFAIFRFLGRILRFLAAPAGPPRARSAGPAAGRPSSRADPGHIEESPEGLRGQGTDPWNPREVIDVDYEELKPGSSGR